MSWEEEVLMHPFYLSDSSFFVCSVFLIFKCFESLYFLPCHSINVSFSIWFSFIDYEFFLFSILFVDFLTPYFFFPSIPVLSYLFPFLSFLTSTSCLIALHNISYSLICSLTFYFLLFLILTLNSVLHLIHLINIKHKYYISFSWLSLGYRNKIDVTPVLELIG